MFIVRYGEIGLKGGNRRYFEQTLAKNIERKLRRYGYKARTRILRGRIFVYASESAAQYIAKCPGVVSVSPAVELDYDDIFDYLEKTLSSYSPATFKVDTHRVDKSFPKTSVEINEEIGAFVVEKFGWKVNLTSPELVIGIEIIQGKAYVFFDKINGVGGLPVGTAGKLVALISSGIDSPVAAYMMMRRGAEIIALHFKQSAETERKVREIVKVLEEYSPKPIELVIVEHASILSKYARALKNMKKEEWMCVFCKYSMLSYASRLAQRKNALGIITGDSLGQVASQTLHNMRLISKASELPIYRPLIGMDKMEIEKIARTIGTYDIFVSSEEEKCPFRPRHVVTKGSLTQFNNILSKIHTQES